MRPLLTVLAILAALPAAAHEYWIEPIDYQPPTDGMVMAHLVNGEDFEGVNTAYIPAATTNYVVVAGGALRPVEMRLGARPGLEIPAQADGLHIVAIETTHSSVTYDEIDAFRRFVEHKDLADGWEAVAARNAEIGAEAPPLVEVYTRHAKALVGVGDAAGTDVRLGLATEFVALDNPYTDDVTEGLRVKLYYDGAVRAEEQVEVFARSPDGSVAITLLRTDGEGLVRVPVAPGVEYMLDAVVLRAPAAGLADATGAAWESLWANLTFFVPAE